MCIDALWCAVLCRDIVVMWRAPENKIYPDPECFPPKIVQLSEYVPNLTQNAAKELKFYTFDIKHRTKKVLLCNLQANLSNMCSEFQTNQTKWEHIKPVGLNVILSNLIVFVQYVERYINKSFVFKLKYQKNYKSYVLFNLVDILFNLLNYLPKMYT